MKTMRSLLPGIAAALALATLPGCATKAPPEVAKAASVPLVNTPWKLTQLGDEIVSTPAGAREINLVLQSQNQRVTGFAGCNQMMGRYALSGGDLRFDEMGSTRMACEGRMDIEQRYLGMFASVARWEIVASTLRLLDAAGKTIATFES
jgi:heat shock protein HslJ